MAAQQAGWIDRIFNSTIGLPQQILWRLIRAAKDEDISLWSEKGLLDFANVPLLGILDTHKEDVMPDAMAETFGLEPGLMNELGVAIATDPLTYLTGGLSALGKAAKGAEFASKIPAVQKVMQTAARAGGRFDLPVPSSVKGAKDPAEKVFSTSTQYAAELTGRDLNTVLERATANLVGKSGDNYGRQLKGIQKAKGMLGGLNEEQMGMKVIDLMKNDGHRKLAVGIPMLTSLGMKIDVPGTHQNWWQAYSAAKGKGGEMLANTWLTRNIAGLPWVSSGLKTIASPVTQFKGGFRVGAEARTAIHTAADKVSPEQFESMSHWLNSATGGGEIAVKISAGGAEPIMKAFDVAVKAGKSPRDALTAAISKIKDKGDTTEQVWARLKGLDAAPDSDTFKKLLLPKTKGTMRKQLQQALHTAMIEGDHARRLARSGQYDNYLTKLDLDLQAKELFAKREELAFGTGLAETAYEAGRNLRRGINWAFKTGTDTQHAQEAMHQYLAHSARGHDQAAQLGKMLYTKVKHILKEPGMEGWTEENFLDMIGGLMESDALQVELVESLKLGKINPSNALDVAKGWDNFVQRHTQVMSSFEGILKSRGVTGETRDKLLEQFQGEVFDYLPRIEEQRLTTHYERLLKVNKDVKRSWTPQQKRRMRRRHNAHILRSGPHRDYQVGELTDDQLRGALDTIENTARRGMRPDEIAAHIDENRVLSMFRQAHGLTHDELITVFRRRGKGDFRRVRREMLPNRFPLWSQTRKSWTTHQAQESVAPFGFSIKRGEKGGYFIRPDVVKEGTAKRSWGWDSKQGYTTIDAAMQDMRKWLDSDTGAKWRSKYGPDMEQLPEAALKKLKQQKDIHISTSELGLLRQAISAADKRILLGTQKKFDEHLLPGYGRAINEKSGDAMDWYRMRQTADARTYSLENKLKEADEYGQGGDAAFEAANTPKYDSVSVDIDAPRALGKEEDQAIFLKAIRDAGGVVFDGVEGKALLDGWARDYARGRLNIAELMNFLKMQTKHNVINPTVPYEMLESISGDLASMGNRVSEITLSQLPDSASELFRGVRHISKDVFMEARRTGVYTPGSPIGYVGRFFNHAASQRIARVLGSMGEDELGRGVLMRLSAKHPDRFARDLDNLSLEDLNSLHKRLREDLAQTDRLDPNFIGPKRAGYDRLAKWYEEINETMRQEGYKVKGVSKKLKWTEDRLEVDPVLSLLTRLSNANQENTIEKYFDSVLKASDLSDGNSLMLGGKVVAIWDDAQNPISVSQLHTRAVQRQKTKGLPVRDPQGRLTGETIVGEGSVEQIVKEHEIGKPSWIIIKTDDGNLHPINARMGREDGYGFLQLGEQADPTALDYSPTTAGAFARASTRSDLDSKFVYSEDLLKTDAVGDLLGQHVAFGAQNLVVGAAKTAAQTLQVSSAGWRSFDNVNYMIKSFQTVFRLPFQLMNLSSGVFQAHMAGVTPKNLLASYVDTFKLLTGNTEFIKHGDVLLSLMDVPGFTSKSSFHMPRLDLINAARRNGGAVLTAVGDAELQAHNLDRVDDFHLNLGDGRELAMSDFIKKAGDMQLYGTYASMLSRGSKTIADSLVRLKLQALDTKSLRSMGHRALAGAIEKTGARPGELREVTEAVNRTATAIGLIREGHTMERAIEITKNAHVPYERLTAFERSSLKRAFLYYSFPRHYMPWAWTKFMENPTHLSKLANTIKNDRIISTDEGRAHLKLGDYRVDLGRANANMEASMMIGAFADAFAMPVARMAGLGPSNTYPYDPNVLNDQITDAGLTSFGGAFSLLTGGARLLPQGSRSGARQSNTWDDARRLVWPMKLAFTSMRMMGLDAGTPTKEEQSPFVDYTMMERLISDTDFGLGIRKVRPDQEIRNAYYEYRSLVRGLRLKAAATTDSTLQDKYQKNAELLTETLRAMRDSHDLQEFD